ncbi:MAG: hypothetical protein KME60_26365 [Cyanomargarita calcarea GSE-NOS-MK-12-04C]|jgi:ABC-type transporter Mla subunit MlaD|uniref:Uncharacterized protein n=1 Tax=Cyanomargarita calcarea GSE-NOS-MK-12-04C TaxID=2839659 RepID=A0A951QTJ9_9CYAN|nr:hypothetical protein [Cyanomargarita calcarea GSE-NOS-MK-12-04C]
MAADLNATISALKSGLTSIPPEAAVKNIESWENDLKDAAPEIASALGQLKSALLNGTATPESLSQLLTSVGQKTSSAGAGNAQVEELGSLLSKAGGSLG